MKREKFALLILLVEIVAITVLHSARKSTPPAQAAGAVSPQAQQAAQTTFQWNNNNFSLIRIK